MTYVLAIDNGSQSTKALIVDGSGRVHASGRAPLRPYASPRPGEVVHPDDDVWDSIVLACRRALADFAGEAREIVGVGLCTIRFCRALLRADGTLAHPMMSWMDERASRPHVPDPDVAWLTSSSGYIAHRMTGRFADASANYQGFWPIDARGTAWSGDPADYESTGLDRTMLPDLVAPCESLGEVTVAAAWATGLFPGTPVFATANDKAVEALGAGLRDDRDVLLSLGTYISAMTPAAFGPGGAAHWMNMAARRGAYLAESRGIRRGMWTVSWLRDLLMNTTSGSVAGSTPGAPGGSGVPAGVAGASWGSSAEADLELAAERVAPGSDGVAAVLDWLAPDDQSYRRGAFVGFSGPQGRGHLHRAVLEAIAFTMADHVDAMSDELRRPFRRWIVTGGGARSPLLLQMLADISGLPVHRSVVDDAAGIGAAVCAAVGAGLHPDEDAAVAAMTRTVLAAEPGADRDAYRDLRAWHRGMRERVRALSEWSAVARR